MRGDINTTKMVKVQSYMNIKLQMTKYLCIKAMKIEISNLHSPLFQNSVMNYDESMIVQFSFLLLFSCRLY